MYSTEEAEFKDPLLLKIRSNDATSTVEAPDLPYPETVSCVYPEEPAVSVAQTGKLGLFVTLKTSWLAEL